LKQNPSRCRCLCDPAELAWGLIVPARQCASTATRRGQWVAVKREHNEARKNMMGD
jgi:hypothetical protein